MDPTVELPQGTGPCRPRGNDRHRALGDRGISSPKLWTQIRAQGWHPCMRYRKNTTFCADGGKTIAGATLRLRSRHGLGRSWHRLRSAGHPAPLQPCWWSGTPSRRNPGSSSPTLRRRRSGSVGTPFGSGSSWASKPSRAWAGSGTRPWAALTQLASSRHWLVLSVATLLALAYGTRVEDAQAPRIAPGNLRAPPKARAPNHRDPRTRPARTVSVIRHGIDWLLALCCSRVVSGPASGCWPEPWPATQAQLGDHPSCAFVTPLPTPLSAPQGRFGHGAVHAQPTPVQTLQLVIAFQSRPPQLQEHPSGNPLLKSADAPWTRSRCFVASKAFHWQPVRST